MNSLTISFDAAGEATKVSLDGEITENADFGDILKQTSPRLIFDLAEVKRINSLGVREWINMITRLTKEGRAMRLERCSVPVVNQLNMIANFRGGAEVSSIFAPYFCPSCSEGHQHLVEVTAGLVDALSAPVPCPKCGTAMEFDDLPDSYVAFLG